MTQNAPLGPLMWVEDFAGSTQDFLGQSRKCPTLLLPCFFGKHVVPGRQPGTRETSRSRGLSGGEGASLVLRPPSPPPGLLRAPLRVPAGSVVVAVFVVSAWLWAFHHY